jgi:hypothetical protein
MSSAGILRYGAARMARYAFDDPMAVSSSGGSWKSLFYFALAAAGVGFAGYVYLVPYQKMEHAAGSNQSAIADQQRAAEAAMAERDKMKADLDRYKSAADDKSTSAAKHKTTIDTLATTLKPGLEALGGTVAAGDGALGVSFPAAKMIDANGIDVSDSGAAAIKILAETAKRESARVRIRARSSSAAPPKELRSLFHTAGEMNAVRAARVMSALEHAGLAPARITIVGDVAEKGASARPARGKKAAAVSAGADRVELEIEPE